MPRGGRYGGGGRQNRQGRGGRGRGRGGFRGGGGRGRGGRGHNNLQRGGAYMEPEVLGTPSETTSLCVAVQGCCHGELDAIYQQLRGHEEKTGQKVDVLLCCGDFQSLRNIADYHSLAVPPKYRELGSFCRYYSGEKTAPVLTIFIGGNHEASQPLQELYYGGWVAPNIYYLGAAGVVNVCGVRIGGISGIYKSHDYVLGRFERPPYDQSSLRSVYHVRNLDVYRMKCLNPDYRINIMLSHDWPQGIEQNGDTATLLRQKPFFRDEVQRNQLGSPPNCELLEALRPQWWFSAHLHVKFRATVQHLTAEQQLDGGRVTGLVPSQVTSGQSEQKKSAQAKDESIGQTSSSTEFVSLESSNRCAGPDLTDQMTQFLALDKCLPRRQHLSILHIPCEEGEVALRYDLEWLVILKKTYDLTVASKRRVQVPLNLVRATTDEMNEIRQKLEEREVEGKHPDNVLAIPQNFRQTVPAHDNPCWQRGGNRPLPMMGNPQTDELLSLLDLNHVLTVPWVSSELHSDNGGGKAHVSIPEDENEIDLEEDAKAESAAGETKGFADDNEIDLDEDESEMEDSDAVKDDGDPTSQEHPSMKKAKFDT